MPINNFTSAHMNISPHNLFVNEQDDAIIILNTISGAIFELEKSIYDKYQNSNENEYKNLPYYSELLDLGFFSSYADSEIRGKTLTIVLSLSEKCNLKCYYCFEKVIPKQNNNSDVHRNVPELLDAYLSNNQEIDSVFVIWFGGEPLMEAKKIQSLSKSFIEICDNYKKTYSATIITNGTLLNDEFISNIGALHIRSIQLTIDGGLNKFIDNKSGNQHLWQSFNEALCKITNKIIDVKLRINVDRDNILSIKEYLTELAERGVLNMVNISISKIDTLCKAKELSYEEFYKHKLGIIRYLLENLEYQRIDEIFKELSPIDTACSIRSKNAIVIDSQGKCHKCEDDIGLFSPIDISDIRASINEINNNTLQDRNCNNCVIYPICKGGCPKHWDKSNCVYKIEYITNLARIKYNNLI